MSFGSAKRADDTMQAMVDTHADPNHKVPKRSYACDYGNGWHLTSKVERV